MASHPESAEHALIRIVAYHDPVDYGKAKRLLRERLNGECSTDRYREALYNLIELGLIEKPGMAHEYIHITEEGWSHLGGETPRHDVEIDPATVPVCPVCEIDEQVEARW